MAAVVSNVQDAVRIGLHTLEGNRPYLGLRARLSQVWINKWTILILLVLARVLILIGNLKTDIASAEREALSACYQVQSSASAVASLPHYMAGGANELVAKTVEGAVSVLSDTLGLLITLLEAIFDFWIDMFLGTYECLFIFAVGGSLSAVIGATEDAVNAIDGAVTDVANTIESDWNDFWSGLERVVEPLSLGNPSWFDILPKFDFNSSLNSLKNIQLPQTYQNDLNKINSSIPNFQEVKATTQAVVNIPFEYAKFEINKQFQSYSYNRSTFMVPEQKQLSFCDNQAGVTDFFDGLYNVAEVARKVFIGVLVTAAALACVPVAILTIYQWNMMNQHVALASKGWERSKDMLETAYILQHPTMAKAGNWLASFKRTEKKKTLARWYVAYITSIPALVLLALALAGLFACLCQYIIARAIQHEVPLLADRVIDYSTQIAEAVVNSSAEWAEHTNAQITYENAKFNNDVFGWVNVSTTAVNDTLNTFVDDTIRLLNESLGGTPLYNPVLDVFNCLIGYKIRGIESGLTWVQDHAHVTFPEFPIDLFSSGTTQMLGVNVTANVTTTPSPSHSGYQPRVPTIVQAPPFPSAYSGFLPNLSTEAADVSTPTPLPTSATTSSQAGFALTALPGFLSSEIGLSSLHSPTPTPTPTQAASNSSISMAGAAIGSDITKSVNALVDALYAGIKQEVFIASALLLLYFVVMIMGGIYVLYANHRREKSRGEGGVSYAGDLRPQNSDGTAVPAMEMGQKTDRFVENRRSHSTPPITSHGSPPMAAPPYDSHRFEHPRSPPIGVARSGSDDISDEKAPIRVLDYEYNHQAMDRGQYSNGFNEHTEMPNAAYGRNRSAPPNREPSRGMMRAPGHSADLASHAVGLAHNKGDPTVGVGNGGQRGPAPVSEGHGNGYKRGQSQHGVFGTT